MVVRKAILIVSLLLLSLFATSALAADSPEISVTLISQSPDPVEPGEIVKLKFKVENNGRETSEDATVKLRLQEPFQAYGPTQKPIGKLRASSTGADAVIVEFEVLISEDAVERDSEIELEVQTGAGSITYNNDEFLVDIQTRDAILDITSVKAPEIAPGDDAKVEIMVQNLADSLLKDIVFTLDLNSDDIPLAPYQSASQQRLSVLKSQFQNSLNFRLIAEPDASPGLYKIPATITYNDEQGNSYSVSEIIAISIGGAPQLRASITKAEANVRSSGNAGPVTVEIANAGTTDVKFMQVTILEDESFTLVSPANYFYIGDIDSDDTETQEIQIFTNGRKQVSIPLKLNYQDANNNLYEEHVTLDYNLYSSSKLKRFGLVERRGGTGILVFVVLAGAGYYYYRRKKKAKVAKKKR